MHDTGNKQKEGNYSVKPDKPAVTGLQKTTVTCRIPEELTGWRLDRALAQLLPRWSRSQLRKWITQDRVRINGASATVRQKIWGGEAVELVPDQLESEQPHQAQAIPLEIVYEDEALIVLNKPAGLVVHPGNGNWQGTLLNALLNHAPQLQDIPRAGIVHRLDKDTTGLLVVTKTIAAQQALIQQFKQRTVERHYQALVLGDVIRGGVIDAPIGRHPVSRTRMAVVAEGKPARTHYQVAERFALCTLLCCQLESGRTHQIRVHLQSIGHPLVGDPVYGRRSIGPAIASLIAPLTRQALHAQKLVLTHPVNGQRMAWEIPLPEDLTLVVQTLRTALLNSAESDN